MQIPRFRCKMTLHLIPEPEEKASELLRDLNANDSSRGLVLANEVLLQAWEKFPHSTNFVTLVS
jgi:hypothetical protein